MKIATTLEKLEERARETILCDWCRYVSDGLPLAVKPSNDPDLVFKQCPWCGAKSNVPVKGFSPHQKETYLLFAGKYEGERFRDERVSAAIEWFHHSLHSVKRWAVAADEVERVLTAFLAEQRREEADKAQGKQLRGEALRQAEIKEKAWQFRQQKFKEELERYGPVTFSLPDRIKQLKEEIFGDCRIVGTSDGVIAPTDDEKWLRGQLVCCRIAELCEHVLWGETLPETRLAIDNLLGVVNKASEERREQIRKAEAKREAERQAEAERCKALKQTSRVEPLRLVQRPEPVEPPVAAPKEPEFDLDRLVFLLGFGPLVGRYRQALKEQNQGEAEMMRRHALDAADAPPNARQILDCFLHNPDSSVGSTLLQVASTPRFTTNAMNRNEAQRYRRNSQK